MRLIVLAAIVIIASVVIFYITSDGFDDASMENGVSTQVSHSDKVIPGLKPVDVYGELHYRRDLSVAGPVRDEGRLIWDCRKNVNGTVFSVLITSQNDESIEVIEASTDGADPDSAKDFLGFVASIKYEGADPEAARAWVLDNLGQSDAETVIAGVKFRLMRGAHSASVLRIAGS